MIYISMAATTTKKKLKNRHTYLRIYAGIRKARKVNKNLRPLAKKTKTKNKSKDKTTQKANGTHPPEKMKKGKDKKKKN